jgi:hypothetical protein
MVETTGPGAEGLAFAHGSPGRRVSVGDRDLLALGADHGGVTVGSLGSRQGRGPR